ncbi:MAG TPA: hypothetical protein VFZ61_23005 [Polyangiales bacterium]
MLLLAIAGGARAYEEQLGLELAVGYANLGYNETLSSKGLTTQTILPANLAALDVGVSVGLGEWAVLRGALGYGALLEDPLKTRQVGRFRLEAAYLIDIVQWVPFLGLGGGLWLVQDPGAGVDPRADGHIVFGIDYLATRAWTVGLDVRTGFLWGDGRAFNVTEGQLRLSRMFELF